MPTFTHTQAASVLGLSLPSTDTFDGTLIAMPSQACADSATTVINLALDVSATQAFAIMSTEDVTVKTNSEGSPDNTLALLANFPYIWTTKSYDSFKLTTDVVTLHVVNASGGSADVAALAIVDSTP